ncbi:hypothetical protein F6X54_03505, partial [Micromonospora aurantiaca]
IPGPTTSSRPSPSRTPSRAPRAPRAPRRSWYGTALGGAPIYQDLEAHPPRARHRAPRRLTPVTFLVVPSRGPSVARPGMTSCPCRSGIAA